MSKRLICCCNDLLNERFTRRFRIALPCLVLSLILLLQAITPAVAISQTPADPSSLTITGGTTTSPPPTTTGKTYYVATNGSDSYSCAQAKNISTPKRNIMGASGGLSCLVSGAGDILDIRAGTYNETIGGTTGAIPVIPIGTSYADAATIRGHAGEAVTIRGIGMKASQQVGGIKYVILDNLIVDPNGASGDAVQFRSGAHHVRLQNSEIKNAQGMGLSIGNASVEGGGSFIEVINVSIHDSGQAPADPHGGYGMYIRGNDNLFHRLRIYDNPGYGIHNYNSGSTSVSNNTYSAIEVYNNGGSEQTQYGIIMTSGSNNRLINSIIRGNTRGVQIGGGCVNCLIYNNTIYQNTKANGPLCVGCAAQNDRGININAGASGTIVKNNILRSNPINGITNNGTNSTISNNHCDSAATGCSVTGDPLFSDAANDNFVLRAGSPAVDKGVALSGVPLYDIKGTFRPLGAGWDIGAFESQ